MTKGSSPRGGAFPSTQWSHIDRAGHAPTQIRRQALDELLKQYLPPIRSHLIHKKKIQYDLVDDLIQGFVTSRIIEKDLVSRVERERGKFRTFLLTALDRYVTSEFRHRCAQRRSPGVMVHLDQAPEPSDRHGVPDRLFEIEWARRIIIQAYQHMIRECKASGRNDLWWIFKWWLRVTIYERATPRYEEIVQRFELRARVQALNLVITSKRKFRRALHHVVSQYTDSAHVDQEIHELMQILADSKGL